MAINISNTIQQFRQDVLGRGGPQISAFYRVTMALGSNTIVTYPMSVIIPGRQFVYYEHDLWGPNRKVPYKRGYTQCHMTFIAYQDWAERTFVETWMNTIIKHRNSKGIPGSSQSSVLGQSDPAISLSNQNAAQQFVNSLINGALSGDSSFDTGAYDDYIQYSSGTGTIVIECLNSQNRSRSNLTIALKEAFPAAISQMSIASDGSGYPTYNVTFQFNDYVYLANGSAGRITQPTDTVSQDNPTNTQTGNPLPVKRT